MGEELQGSKFFVIPKDCVDFQELNIVESENFTIEDSNVFPRGTIDETKEFSLSFDMEINPKVIRSVRKLFKHRLPRKFKKRYKNMIAKRFDIEPNKLRFYNIWKRN